MFINLCILIVLFLYLSGFSPASYQCGEPAIDMTTHNGRRPSPTENMLVKEEQISDSEDKNSIDGDRLISNAVGGYS